MRKWYNEQKAVRGMEKREIYKIINSSSKFKFRFALD
jgi:hypothetical protein